MADTPTALRTPPIAPGTPALERLEQLFKGLADCTRLRILALLADGEVCVCEIHEALGIPQPTASRHLAYLRRAGLVDDRREGLWVYYRIAGPDEPVVRMLLDAVRHGLAHVAEGNPPRGTPLRSGRTSAFTCCRRD